VIDERMNIRHAASSPHTVAPLGSLRTSEISRNRWRHRRRRRGVSGTGTCRQIVCNLDCQLYGLYHGDVVRDTNYGAEVALPVFLRPGRGVYGMFIREALAAEGFTDMPANGGFVLGLIQSGGSALSDVIADLGVSKQTASQLVDTLVVRGYLARSVDPDDRRRVLVTLTERGKAAADAVLVTVHDIDARLLAAVGAERLAHTKETLAALVDLWPPSK